MLMSHSKYFAQLLDSLSMFGERVRKCMMKDPEGLAWSVMGPIWMERDEWPHMCFQVLRIVRLLGFDEDADADSPWRKCEELSAAASRAISTFGGRAPHDAKKVPAPVAFPPGGPAAMDAPDELCVGLS